MSKVLLTRPIFDGLETSKVLQTFNIESLCIPLLEIKKKIHKVKTYKNYFKKVFEHGKKMHSIIEKIKSRKKIIYGLGASTKGNVLLQNSRIDHTLLSGIFDVNKEKFNKYTPGTNIPIKDELILKKNKPDYIFLLVWHFKNSIKFKLKKFVYTGGKLLSPFPRIKIISKKPFNSTSDYCRITPKN